MKNYTLINGGSISVTSTSSGRVIVSENGFQAVWDNFNYPLQTYTKTLPEFLLRSTTQIIDVDITASENYAEGNGYMTPTLGDKSAYVRLLQQCQRNKTQLVIGCNYQGSPVYSGEYESRSEAASVAASAKKKIGKVTNIKLIVYYEDYETTVDDVGQFDLTPSTNKVLGGKTSLGATIRITPYVNIPVGALDFYIYPEGQNAQGVSLTNNTALSANQETTFTLSPQLFPVVDATNLSTVYNAKVDVKLNNIVKATLDWSSKLQIKSGCEPITGSGAFHTWSDGAGYYDTYQAFINARSTPTVNVDLTNYHYDNFLEDNALILSMNITDGASYSQNYTLTNGDNNIPCPPSLTGDSTSYTCSFTLIDNYNQTLALPSDTIQVLTYNVPVPSGVNVQRYYIDEIEGKVIDDEGTQGELIGQIAATQFSGSLENDLSLVVTVTSTNDPNWTVPFECYRNDDMQPVDGIIDLNNIPISGTYDSAYTYNFEIVFNDGLTTNIQYVEFSTAESYFLVEKEGVAVGGRTTGAIGDERFDIHYPMNISSIDQFYGRTYDTGWVDQTIASTNKLESNTWVQCRRIGKIVNVRGLIVANSRFAAGNEETVSTLDTDFRPSGIVRFQAGAYSQLWTISINPTGTLQEHNGSGAAPSGDSTKSNRFNVTYFVD